MTREARLAEVAWCKDMAERLDGWLLDEMRSHLADCVWADIDSDGIAVISDWVVVRGIERHVVDGVAGFIRCCLDPEQAGPMLVVLGLVEEGVR